VVTDFKKKYKNHEYGKIIKVSTNFVIVKCGSGLIKLKNIIPKLSAKKGDYL
jgi:methionyl-tRNA formyltransferase